MVSKGRAWSFVLRLSVDWLRCILVVILERLQLRLEYRNSLHELHLVSHKVVVSVFADTVSNCISCKCYDTRFSRGCDERETHEKSQPTRGRTGTRDVHAAFCDRTLSLETVQRLFALTLRSISQTLVPWSVRAYSMSICSDDT
jgi:hypothetical protein